MIRKLDSELNLYICQCADWQCVVEAEDEEMAATAAIERVMLMEEKSNIGAYIAVKKIESDIYYPCPLSNEIIKRYYSPTILANAGFHSDAVRLSDFLNKQDNNSTEESDD